MNILTNSKSANAVSIRFDEIQLHVILEDGRELNIQIDWFPSLRDATQEHRENWRFIGDGEGILWKELDEEILIEGLL